MSISQFHKTLSLLAGSGRCSRIPFLLTPISVFQRHRGWHVKGLCCHRQGHGAVCWVLGVEHPGDLSYFMAETQGNSQIEGIHLLTVTAGLLGKAEWLRNRAWSLPEGWVKGSIWLLAGPECRVWRAICLSPSFVHWMSFLWQILRWRLEMKGWGAFLLSQIAHHLIPRETCYIMLCRHISNHPGWVPLRQRLR